MAAVWEAWLSQAAAARSAAGLDRTLVQTVAGAEPWAERDGHRLLNLATNNYLGLAGHPALIEATRRGAARGAGAGSSRLVAGHDAAHAAVEEKLAAFKGTERALVLGSGFAGNVGTIAALLDRGCAVISDRLNHASIIDGCRLSGAEVLRYGHRALDELEASLAGAARDAKRALVVTDTVFSMDGDVAPLAEIVELKDRYGAALMIDDAHGTGVLGPGGRGAAHAAGVADRIEVQLGTFSKAFGVYGAYVAGARAWVRHLTNACRPLVFSTGLPPPTVAAIDAAIDLVRQSDDRRLALRAKADTFRRALTSGGLNTGASTTQIVPAIVGDNERAVALATALQSRGLLAVAIRPPTVPPGEARIRFSLMATHDDTDLARAAAAIVEEASSLSPPAGGATDRERPPGLP
jgi:8-amino-7-oxononanoate synthase